MSAQSLSNVTLEVSRDGLIRTLADQFSSRTTFISELMQNARRAGASRIDIEYSGDGILTIRDDGEGISSPQALLTIGKSGWNNLELLDTENPFGIGFAAAIFASSWMQVKTAGWSAHIETEKLLAFEPIAILSTGATSGTEVSLKLQPSLVENFEKHQDALRNTVLDFACGFPTPVIFNGEELSQPDQIDDSFRKFEYGYVRCAFSPTMASLEADIYLQGIAIRQPYRRHSRHRSSITVHLNPTAFRARVPDRNVLIDEDDALRAIRSALRAMWLDELKMKREAMSPVDFVEMYSAAAVRLQLHHDGILDSLPLASALWGYYESTPRYEKYSGEGQAELSCEPGRALSETVQIISEVCYSGEETSAAAVYAARLGWPVLTQPLNSSHWAQKHLIDTTALDFAITPGAVVVETGFDGNYIWGLKLVLCESFTMAPSGKEARSDLPVIEVTDEAVYCSTTGKVFVPRGAVDYDTLEQLALHLNTYMSENEDFDETLLDIDVQDLLGVVKAGFGDSPEEILVDMLNRSSCGLLRSLANQSFSVSFSDSGQPTVSMHHRQE
jgi:hypothetical protein